MHNFYTVQYLEACVPVEEYLRDCVDVDKFLGYCRACGNYERRWSCPPFDFDPLAFWQQYHTFHIYAHILVAAPGAELFPMLNGMRDEKNRLMEKLLHLELGIQGSLALSAGGCALCGDNCSRSSGMSCRKPKEMRYSIDALGGDISKTMELYFKRPILWIENGKVPDYLTLVGGLLLREESK